MTDTSQSEPLELQTNGIENGLGNEDERAKLRPADIDADVREMERRKRVEMIMSSKLFREELERIIELQMKDGNGPAGLLQQISDMMGIQSGKLHTTHMFRGSNCVTPINDIRGVESMGYAKGEKNLRCKLASVFRLMDLYGWSQGIHNQITARLNQDEEHFLVNPYGMLYNEITASSLVKVDMQGAVVETGTTNFNVNIQGFLLHSAIHAARPDIKCIIHIHTPSVLAVSSLKCGLLPLCQEALVIGEVSQHPFVGGIFEPEEREKIIRNLGPANKVLLLNNHGAVCCGSTVEEAFFNVYNTVLACETQIKLMPMGIDNLVLVNDETRKQVYDAAHRAPETSAVPGEKKAKQFRVGELEFEALIRMLDNAGFRTGYIYRHPLVKGEVPKPKNDVEVPPAVSSLGYLIEEEEMYKQGNWKKYIDGRNRLDRTKWLTSPNVYQKVEILETGTPDPKKITKWVDQNSEEWVAESSPTHSSTPVKIESALQFVPKGTNPKEFKKLQQQIKENRLADKITSGPQSHILEGVTWEEAKKLQDANITQTGDQVILVGAASKGIIQRSFQHNALVYKTPYAKNPFDSVSDKEIEEYRRLVERKQKGDTDYEESQSESEAMSSSRQDALRHIKSPLMSPQSATSETEEESRDEPRVLRIETKTAPRPIQAEVVLSDAEFDTIDARVERSQSARYPKPEKPESVTIINSFRKSWSLKRDKNKDIESPDECDSRNGRTSPVFDCKPIAPLCCIARIKQLKELNHTPVLFDVKPLYPMLKSKSKSEPCNLFSIDKDEIAHARRASSMNGDDTATFPLTELQNRLNERKRSIHTAKMKFLGLESDEPENMEPDMTELAASPIRILFSAIRNTISDMMSPGKSEKDNENIFHESMRWIQRPPFVPKKSAESQTDVSHSTKSNQKEKTSRELSFHCILSKEDKSSVLCETYDIENHEKENVDDEESIAHTYSFTESTRTDWYYNKTILNPENSQTMLEVKRFGGNEEAPVIKASDTGIDTDFTSDDPNSRLMENISPIPAPLNTTEEVIGEVLGLSKSSETDSSFFKSSSGRTSNDVDTSGAFKTETENSEKSEAAKDKEEAKEKNEGKKAETKQVTEERLPDIPESPEFLNVDTEDAPATSSSKDTSPEVANQMDTSKEEPPMKLCAPAEVKKQNPEPPKAQEQTETKSKRKGKKKKNKKNQSSTKITVKKEITPQNSTEAVVSEIKLTIKNNKRFQSEKYDVKIEDGNNTSGEMSRTMSSTSEDVFENIEIVEGDCECEAQQNLENLQGEVCHTIEKLQNIGNYFHEEIKKRSEESSLSQSNENEELVIEYNYQESGEVLSNDFIDNVQSEVVIGDVNDFNVEGCRASLCDATEEVDGCLGLGESEVDGYLTAEERTTDLCEMIAGLKIEDISDVVREEIVDSCPDVQENETPAEEVPEVCLNVEISTEGKPTRVLIDANGNEISEKDRSLMDSVLESILDRVFFEKKGTCVSEVVAFILNNEESPPNSLTEFEDMENMISASDSLATELELDEDVLEVAALEPDVVKTKTKKRENTVNGDHSDAHQSTFSHSSKEGSPTKDRSTEESPKKDKKKKKGLRTPSFLKKKKEKKKLAES